VALYLLGLGSGCPDCADDDPCTSGGGVVESCTMPPKYGGPVAGSHSASFDVTGHFVAAQNITIYNSFSDAGALTTPTGIFEVFANGSSIYSSGLQTSWSDTDVVSVPAGTTTLSVTMTVFGVGGHNMILFYYLTCSPPE
jgi:hypothetical protein